MTSRPTSKYSEKSPSSVSIHMQSGMSTPASKNVRPVSRGALGSNVNNNQSRPMSRGSPITTISEFNRPSSKGALGKGSNPGTPMSNPSASRGSGPVRVGAPSRGATYSSEGRNSKLSGKFQEVDMVFMNDEGEWEAKQGVRSPPPAPRMTSREQTMGAIPEEANKSERTRESLSRESKTNESQRRESKTGQSNTQEPKTNESKTNGSTTVPPKTHESQRRESMSGQSNTQESKTNGSTKVPPKTSESKTEALNNGAVREKTQVKDTKQQHPKEQPKQQEKKQSTQQEAKEMNIKSPKKEQKLKQDNVAPKKERSAPHKENKREIINGKKSISEKGIRDDEKHSTMVTAKTQQHNKHDTNSAALKQPSKMEEQDEEIDVQIMKRKEMLFEKEFKWNARVRWDVVQSDVFSPQQCEIIQGLVGKKAAYQGLIDALRDAEGSEDLADLATALHPTNPLIAEELNAELDLELGLLEVEEVYKREAVKCVRMGFGRRVLNNDDEKLVISLISNRMQYANQVWSSFVKTANQEVKKEQDKAEFDNSRINRLANELNWIMEKNGAAGNNSNKEKKSTKKTAKPSKKKQLTQEEDLEAFKCLDTALDQFFAFSKQKDQEAKKCEEERSKAVKKCLKKKHVDDLVAEIEQEIEKRQERLREIGTAPKEDITDEQLEALEKELVDKEKEQKGKLKGYRVEEIQQLKEKKKEVHKERDAIKEKRNEKKDEVKDVKYDLDLVKMKVERLEKVLSNVLKNANYQG